MPSSSFYPSTSAITTDKFIPALQHAISGSAGTLISTCTLYPLSLVITRLQAQRQLHRTGKFAGTTTSPNGHVDPTARAREPHGGIAEAFSRIWNSDSDGGPRALYTGLAQDAAKSVLDSFLFFLFYEWMRSARLSAASQQARGRRVGGMRTAPSTAGLGVFEELAIGMVAGACSKLFTTPIANIVARQKMAGLVDADGELGVREIIDSIRKEQGVSGFWSGYSANLVLALNPSITFFLQDFLKKKAAASGKWDTSAAYMTFLLAAISRAVASTVTYPFQVAQTRIQTGIPVEADTPRERRAGASRGMEGLEGGEVPKAVEASKEGEEASARSEFPMDAGVPAGKEIPAEIAAMEAMRGANGMIPHEQSVGREIDDKLNALRAAGKFGRQSVLGTIGQIARNEGIGSLYDGLPGELLKGFLSHGTTMMAKEAMHKILFKLYIFMGGVLAELRARRAKTTRLAEPVPVPVALQYRLDLNRHSISNGSTDIINNTNTSDRNKAVKAVARWRRRRRSSLGDFGVNVVANMIDGTQRGIKHR
ncbi:hypothetical protein AAE478_003353 [Parahypoxylon ruwenzoriense]